MMLSHNRVALAAAFVAGLALAACGRHEGPAEQAGKRLDRAVQEAGEAVGKAVEATGKAVEKTGEKIQDSVKK